MKNYIARYGTMVALAVIGAAIVNTTAMALTEINVGFWTSRLVCLYLMVFGMAVGSMTEIVEADTSQPDVVVSSLDADSLSQMIESNNGKEVYLKP